MKSEIITKLEAHIASECNAIDREERFDAMLDECYSFESVGGPFAYMSPSRVLKEMDETAYRCGVNDFEDSEEWVEVGDSYYEKDEAEKALEEFKLDIESEIEDLESEIEDEDTSEYDAAELKEQLKELKAALSEVENYSL